LHLDQLELVTDDVATHNVLKDAIERGERIRCQVRLRYAS